MKATQKNPRAGRVSGVRRIIARVNLEAIGGIGGFSTNDVYFQSMYLVGGTF